VHPREEIMVPTPERRTTTIKADVDDKIPNAISLSAAEEIIAYKPIVVARELTTPLMVIGVTGDATTPTDHAEALYEAARGPKSLIMQHHTTHYAAYDRYWEQTTPRIVAWFEQYVRPVDVAVRTTLPDVAGETTQNLEAPL
jgi:dipeptidyl aminopeptidase/acylaminoacyl peptidase